MLVLSDTGPRCKTMEAAIVRARVAKLVKLGLKSTDTQIVCLMHGWMAVVGERVVVAKAMIQR